MDTVKFSSPVNFTQADNGAFRAHATLPDGNTVTFEQVAIFMAGTAKKDYKRVTIKKNDGSSFDKWFLLGRSFDLEVKPTGAKTGEVIKATVHVAKDDLNDEQRNLFAEVTAVPAKQGGTAAPAAGGFAAAVAAASDPLVG